MNDTKTILVIEDERALQEVVKAKLTKEGFGVVTARSAEQAIEYLREDIPISAVWLDHYLLGKDDGLTIVSLMKEENSSLKQVPIFVVSNTASPEKVQSYIRFGVSKYYTKSNYRLDEIISDMRTYLDTENE